MIDLHKYQLKEAYSTGYSDAYFDGIDTSHSLPCQCSLCLKAYQDGQEEAFRVMLESSIEKKIRSL
jgi:hypothetical protein